MYKYASYIFAEMLNPIGISLVSAACALLLWRRRSLSFALVSLSFVVLLIPGCPVVAVRLFHFLERTYPDRGINAIPGAQAIVVLGGAVRMPGGEHPNSGMMESSDRLLLALRLYHARKAPIILLSGGNNLLQWNVSRPAEAQVMSALLQEWGVPSSAILVEPSSTNTRENAVFSQRLLASHGIAKIILVTSALHMRRAVASFQKMDLEVFPAPADFRTGWREDSGILEWIPEAAGLSMTTAALREWLGFCVYRLRGWT